MDALDLLAPVVPVDCDCPEPCGWAHFRPSGVVVEVSHDRAVVHVVRDDVNVVRT